MAVTITHHLLGVTSHPARFLLPGVRLEDRTIPNGATTKVDVSTPGVSTRKEKRS